MTSILIIGSGALASAYATKLSQNPGNQVQLFCEWQDGIQAIHNNGILCHYQNKLTQTPPLCASTNPADITPADLILILVKSWQTQTVVSQIKDKLNPDGICLTLQNGLGNLQILDELFSADKVIAGTTMLGAELLAPAEVQINFIGKMELEEDPSAEWIIPIFQESGFEIQTNPNLESVLWGKLLINAVVNPLTAIFQQRNGILLSSMESKALMDAMIDEIIPLVQKKNITLPYPDAHQQVRMAVQQTAMNFSSMAQDWKRNATTEIDTITGAILKEAQIHHIEMPVNQTIYQLIKAGIAAKNM